MCLSINLRESQADDKEREGETEGPDQRSQGLPRPPFARSGARSEVRKVVMAAKETKRSRIAPVMSLPSEHKFTPRDRSHQPDKIHCKRRRRFPPEKRGFFRAIDGSSAAPLYGARGGAPRRPEGGCGRPVCPPSLVGKQVHRWIRMRRTCTCFHTHTHIYVCMHACMYVCPRLLCLLLRERQHRPEVSSVRPLLGRGDGRKLLSAWRPARRRRSR